MVAACDESRRAIEVTLHGVVTELEAVTAKLDSDDLGPMAQTLVNLEQQIGRIGAIEVPAAHQAPDATPAPGPATEPPAGEPRPNNSSVMSAIAKLKQLRT